MPHYPDMSQYSHVAEYIPPGEKLLSVGWLDNTHDYPRGQSPVEFVTSLGDLCANHRRARVRHWEKCRLGHPGGAEYPMTANIAGQVVNLGDAEVRVVSKTGDWLVAPTLIYHYVTEHQYLPPADFIEAVTARRIAPTWPEGY